MNPRRSLKPRASELAGECKSRQKYTEIFFCSFRSQRTGPGRIKLDRMGRQLENHVGTFNELLQQEKTATKQPSKCKQFVLDVKGWSAEY